MMEEGFKAVEGPTTKRHASGRRAEQDYVWYSTCNRGFEPEVAGAPEVLCVDTMVCEDATIHGLQLARIPTDYEKYFNMLDFHEVEAVWQMRGLQDQVRRLCAEAFNSIRVPISKKWGSRHFWS